MRVTIVSIDMTITIVATVAPCLTNHQRWNCAQPGMHGHGRVRVHQVNTVPVTGVTAPTHLPTVVDVVGQGVHVEAFIRELGVEPGYVTAVAEEVSIQGVAALVSLVC